MVGILAYGSLIGDPGDEIKRLVVRRIDIMTPFPVEFARYSKNRGGAPTVVPVTKGGDKVKAQILVLEQSVSVNDAKTLLWRRETNQMGSSEQYAKKQSRNALRVCCLTDWEGVDTVLYTDFYADSKIRKPSPRNLAIRAIKSVRQAAGRDGITYLLALKKAGVITPMTEEYERQIIKRTATSSLEQALIKCQQKHLRATSLLQPA
jgi:hypothetical protein